MNPREKLSAARMMVKDDKRSPYLAAALDGLIMREAPGLKTLGVSERGVMLYDPARLIEWSVDEIATVLEHEVWHLIRNHAQRCKQMGADPLLWNIAGDAEINDDLVAAGRKLPGTGPVPANDLFSKEWSKMFILPSSLGMADGKLAEEYYNAARQAAQKQQPKGGKGKGSKSKEGSPGEGQGEDQEPGEGQEGSGQSKGGPAAPEGAGGWCGSAGGREIPGEPKDGGGTKGKEKQEGQSGMGDPSEGGEGRTDAELAQIRKQTAEAIIAQAAKGRGNIPAGFARWAEDALKPPKIHWSQKLARAARSCVAYRPGCQDYYYGKPSRRQWGLGSGAGKPILPAMHSPVPEVLIIADTSGSMGPNELKTVVSESAGILKATSSNVSFMACDCDIHALRPVRHWKDLTPLLKGGGGTDFRPPFEQIDNMKKRPDVVIFITDGCGPCPLAAPPRVSVIWVLVGPYKQRPTCCGPRGGNERPLDWGTIIEVPDEDIRQDAA